LFENCKNGTIKFLYITGEDPAQYFYKGSLARSALQTVPFLVVQDLYMTETARHADIILPAASYAEKDGTFTNLSRHVQRVSHAVIPEGDSRPDFEIFCDLAEALGKPFNNTDLESVQQEIQKVVASYRGTFPGDASSQWIPDSSQGSPGFSIGGAYKKPGSEKGVPFTLIANNHMFHIGSYSRHAQALTDVAPECRAGIHPADAKKLQIKTGDRVIVESKNHKVELSAEVNPAQAKGVVHIPKNWIDIPVNRLRNGEEGLISIKVSKAE